MKNKLFKANKLNLSALSHTSIIFYRLFLFSLAKIYALKKQEDLNPLKVNVNMFNNFFELKSHKTFTLFNEIARDYKNIFISFSELEKTQVFSNVSYSDGYIFLTFTPNILNLITNTGNFFTIYELEEIKAIESYYALRIYELIQQFHTLGKFSLSLKKLRFILSANAKSYDVNYRFVTKVIQPALFEINTKFNLNLRYEIKNKSIYLTFNPSRFIQVTDQNNKNKPLILKQKKVTFISKIA